MEDKSLLLIVMMAFVVCCGLTCLVVGVNLWHQILMDKRRRRAEAVALRQRREDLRKRFQDFWRS